MDALQLIREWCHGLSDNRIRVAQSVTAVAQMPIILLVNAASAMIVALMLSPAQSPLKKACVVTVLYLILCPMLFSWRRLRHRPIPDNVSRRRIHSLIFYSAFLGCAWSVAIAITLPGEPPAVVTFVIAGVGFLCIGGAAVLASLPLVCLAFSVPILCTALCLSLTASFRGNLGLSLLVVTLACGVAWLVVTGWQPLRRTLGLLADNAQLLAELKAEIARQELLLTEREKSRSLIEKSEQRFRALAELSSDWYWEQDSAYRFTDAFEQRGGMLSPFGSASIGRTRWEIGGNHTSIPWAQHQQDLQERRAFTDFEYQLTRPDGLLRWVSVSGAPRFDAMGRFIGYHGMGKDITERKQSEAALRSSQERLNLALSASRQGLFDLDLTSGVFIVNDDYATMIDQQPTAFRESVRAWYRRVHPDDRAEVRRVWRTHAAQREAGSRLEFRERAAGGRWVWILAVAITRQNKEAFGGDRLIGTRIDVTERKLAQQAVEKLAYFDSLTGLPNRRHLIDRLKIQHDASRRSGAVSALLFIDLDNFKNINDARGHGVGDLYLTAIAARLGGLLRPDDTVARLGGDEFVVLTAPLGRCLQPAAEAALSIGEKVRAALAEPVHIHDQFYFCSASIGITLFPKSDETVDDLLREADTAMYQAKAAGRNRVSFYATAMHAAVKDRLELEHELTHAIERGQLRVDLQSQVDHQEQVVGAELLVRWHHPVLGLISPAEFIPVAEQCGFIVDLGDWVLRQACALSNRLQAAGLSIPLSVNVSPRQFRQNDFVQKVKAALDETRVSAQHLLFEVTEGLLIDDLDATILRMEELTLVGIRFSIDDFGTGYSSLAYLRRLPLYELKIDRSFIQDTPHDPDGVSIVRAMISMAHHLRLRIVAEGVETAEQATFLREAKTDCMQGYLFHRPEPLGQWFDRVTARAEA